MSVSIAKLILDAAKYLSQIDIPEVIKSVGEIRDRHEEVNTQNRIDCNSILEEIEVNIILCKGYLLAAEKSEALIKEFSTVIYDNHRNSGVKLTDIKKKKIPKKKQKKGDLSFYDRVYYSWQGKQTAELIRATYFKIKELKQLYAYAAAGKINPTLRVRYIQTRLEILQKIIDCDQ